MPQARVHNFSVSLDGFGTGEGQSPESPFGHADSRLPDWFFTTRTIHAMHGEPGGGTGADDANASNRGRCSTTTCSRVMPPRWNSNRTASPSHQVRRGLA
jgi:hypothetical protein